MKILHLKRILSDEQGTIGMLVQEGHNQRICYTLELPDRDNQTNLSRIPEGEYLVHFLRRSHSGRYKRVYHLQAVFARSGILIHAGNFAGDVQQGFDTHLHGCIAPCLRLGTLPNRFGKRQRAGLMSRNALNVLRQEIGENIFVLKVSVWNGL